MAEPIEYMAEVVKSLTMQVCEALAAAEKLKTRSDFLQDELDKATKERDALKNAHGKRGK